MARWSAAFMATLFGACQLPGQNFGEGFLCPEPERRCPAGQVCVAGVCQAPTDDAGPDGGGDPVARCGDPAQLGADFETLPFWFDFFGTPGGTMTASGGVLELAVPAIASAEVSSNTKFAVDLRGARVTADILPATGDLEWGLAVIGELGGARIYWRGPGMVVAQHLDENFSAIQSSNRAIGADQTTWSIREEAGELIIEVSADGQAWEPILTAPAGPWTDLASIRFEAVSPGGQGGVARFDNLNGVSALAPGCLTTELASDFESPPSIAVREFSVNCANAVANGEWQMTFAGPGFAVCGFTGAFAYDLAGATTGIEITTPPPGLYNLGLEFETADGFLAIATSEGSLRAHSCPRVGSCDFLADLPFDGGDRFWRMREQGGTIFFEVGAVAAVWREIATLSVPWPVRAGKQTVYLSIDDAFPATVAIDNLNAVP